MKIVDKHKSENLRKNRKKGLSFLTITRVKVQLKIERRRISTPSGHLPNFLDDLKSRRVDFSQRVQFFQLEGPNCTSNQSKDVLFYSYVRTTSHYSHYTLQLHCTRASGKSENLVGTISNTLVQTQSL